MYGRNPILKPKRTNPSKQISKLGEGNKASLLPVNTLQVACIKQQKTRQKNLENKIKELYVKKTEIEEDLTHIQTVKQNRNYSLIADQNERDLEDIRAQIAKAENDLVTLKLKNNIQKKE